MPNQRTLPNLGLTGFWDLGSADWKPGMDSNLLKLSVVTNIRAASRTDSLPGTGLSGDVYINPTDGKINAWDAGAWVVFDPLPGWIAYVIDEELSVIFDGASWVSLTSLVPFQLGVFAPGKPDAGEVILSWVFVGAVTFPANFSGSACSAGTNPTASWSANIKKNGTTIGTLGISTSGVVTFSTTGAVAVSFSVGNTLSIVAPTPQDSTLADLSITLTGKRA